MPDGKFTPCCHWKGEKFNSREEMTQKVGDIFLRGEVPDNCSFCVPGQPSWRDSYNIYPTDYKTYKLKFLDFRNSNLCNLSCRSCGPQYSTQWASELGWKHILFQYPVNLDYVDFSECERIYFAGGEPLLNPAHYEILDRLVERTDNGSSMQIMYSTNLTVLNYKNKHVKDYWPKFNQIYIHGSIDAVGPYAGVVRSGSDWATVEKNLTWARSQSNVLVRISTVISAINVWFLPSLFEYLDFAELPNDTNGFGPVLFEPILAWGDNEFNLSSIPPKFRPDLIDMLSNNKFSAHPNIQHAIEILKDPVYNAPYWELFLKTQKELDRKRNENWFDLLPIKDQL
jgi:sulfatase maturation enzyme AslB (radical SAM superfamily)